jgi:hypothetical protein
MGRMTHDGLPPFRSTPITVVVVEFVPGPFGAEGTPLFPGRGMKAPRAPE